MSFTILTSLSFAVIAVLVLWRQLDRRADAHAWRALLEAVAEHPSAYNPEAVNDLPEAAQRYFNFMIQPGTSLNSAVELEMTGQIARGTKTSHTYQEMSARQIIAAPHGFVWQVEAGLLSGSDGLLPDHSWTRFWLFGLLPVVRVSNVDHHRSAFGRVVAEAVFWSPASLLPSEAVRWEMVDDDTARAVVRHGLLEQAVEVTTNTDGAPTRVLIQRWSNENPDKVYREQPFGGEPSEFTQIGGFRLPMRVEGGNHFGTEAYFPFFRAEVTNVRFRG